MRNRNLFFAFSTLGCPSASWKTAAALARSRAVQGIELRSLNGSIDLALQLARSFPTPQSMKNEVDQRGPGVVALDTSLRLSDTVFTKQPWRELEDLAPWADALSIKYLRVFDGGLIGSGRRPEVRANLRQALNAWASLRQSHGFSWDIMIETHWALADPESCLLLGNEIEAEGGKFNVLWDSCHTWNYSGAGLQETWDMLKPFVRHIHIKDGLRCGESFRYTLPGEGQVPILSLLAILERDEFSGVVSFEWERMWNPELPPLEAALDAGHRNGWW
jgi:sugar phosphate isomerase/epimerase